MTGYWCRHAWLSASSGVIDGVLIEVEGGRIAGIGSVVAPPPDAVPLNGLVVPGFANCHSHVFHRALRGHAQRDGGSFWTWRDRMYLLADRLDPDTFHRLARATYAEMVGAGITAVGEFHYLHHQPGGRPYADPNELAHAAISAAREVGVRITLLDACYLSAGFGRPVEGAQLRFSDGDAERWAGRVDELAAAYTGAPDVVIGAAVHSVRAVPASQVGTVANWAAQRRVPLHVHLSEQPAENEECLAATGRTPTALLAEHEVLRSGTTVVHATHLADEDVTTLGQQQVYACFCPTTERDLADGVGPSRALAAAGSQLTLGTDSHAVVDMCEEMRALELDERLVTLRRGSWQAPELLTAATETGQESLGFAGAGTMAAGASADFVCLRMDSARTAGTGASAETVVFAATSADVTDVVIGGRRVVADSRHAAFPDAAAELGAVITALMAPP